MAPRFARHRGSAPDPEPELRVRAPSPSSESESAARAPTSTPTPPHTPCAAPLAYSTVLTVKWLPYRKDPVAEATGISFDRTPEGKLVAPEGVFRIYAYHVDFDHAPVCYADVSTLDEAQRCCESLSRNHGGFNVDYAVVYDAAGECVHNGRPW